MPQQTSETPASQEQYGRKSEREVFLDQMEQVIPWVELLALAEPHYQPSFDVQLSSSLPVMLRTYFVQQWFNLTDARAEEALCDSSIVRRFVGVDLDVAAAPDEAAIRLFRELLEESELKSEIQETVKRSLDARGIRITTGTNSDATIVEVDAHLLTDLTGGDAVLPYHFLEVDQITSSLDLGDASRNPETEKASKVDAEVQSPGRSQSARVVKVKASPAPSGYDLLSVAVISPSKEHRKAITSVLGECQKGPIREYTSYPPNLEDVPRALNRDFDIIIIDVDSDTEYALALARSISLDGHATVMVCSAKTDSELLVRCMRVGVREFLNLPIATHKMAEALARASALRITDRVAKKTDGRLLVFLGAKGGCGVTTLACNFAVSLAQESGERTLLIDLNLPLGDAAINLGINAEHSIVDALQNSSRLDASFLSTLLVQHPSGLFVLAAPTELSIADIPEEDIDRLLEVARREFDYVVIDAGSRLDLQRTHLFDESTTLYLVTQVGIPELRNSNRLITRLSVAGSPKLEVVINRYDPRTMEIDDEHITKALTRPAQWKIPNNYAAVRRMQNAAIPLTEDDSPISRSILQMTLAVCGQSNALPEKKKGFSFFR
jgi:pilus assembly protein CpaE